ncbi:MAG: hypothetical protein WBA57_20130 [Elainellaceae cyanobacterium]
MSFDSLALVVTLVTVSSFTLLGLINLSQRSLTDVENYIVHRNQVGSSMAIATIVASVIGAWLLLSPAEAATWAGIPGIIGYSIGQAAPLVAFAYLGPRLRQLMPQGHSLTEYVWHRFGAGMYSFTVLISVFYMFVFLAAELTGVALAMNLIANIPLGWTALIVATATLIYTTYGGLQATIFTDNLQFVLILPLLVIVFGVTTALLGGLGTALAPLTAVDAPPLLSPTNAPGVEFGFALIIAILAANLFHQGFWQRVYACRDLPTLRRSYWIAGLIVVPMIILSGMIGLMAVGHGVPPEQASVALFALVKEVMPPWALLLVLVLALALVMSSMDTLINGISSTVVSDLARWRSHLPAGQLMRIARIVTVIVTLPAIAIASQGYSVLYLFLIADLVCAGAMVPVFYGLYSRQFSGSSALISCLVGIAAGLLFFPKPDFTPIFAIPLAGRFLVSFGAALVVSSVLAIALSQWLDAKQSPFDFAELEKQVHNIRS